MQQPGGDSLQQRGQRGGAARALVASWLVQGNGQQQRHAAPNSLPPASRPPTCTAACLPRLAPPLLQPGELRLRGLTFHPDLAPGVRRAMADWGAGSALAGE